MPDALPGRDDARDGSPEGLAPLQTILIAAACGALVANLYYAQPLIDLIGGDLGLGESVQGMIVTATQLGYALGLIFLVPLGDIFENRKLVLSVMTANIVALGVMVMTGSATSFLIAVFAVGITSTAAQLLVPLAAGLTPQARRGATVGRVMSGLLMGILLARPVASFLADIVGWRGVFVVSAVAIAAIMLALLARLPGREVEARISYFALLRSLGALLAREPVLRRRVFYHAMMFATFSLFWTGAPLLLLSDSYGFTQRGVALFALAGVLGVFAAPVAGSLADRGHGWITSVVALAAGVVAFGLAFFGQQSLAALVAASVIVDLGVQANLVVSQREIYSLEPAVRNRLNAVFISIFFLGGAVGSALTSPLLHYFGWRAFASAGIAFPAIALVAFLIMEPRAEPSRQPAE